MTLDQTTTSTAEGISRDSGLFRINFERLPLGKSIVAAWLYNLVVSTSHHKFSLAVPANRTLPSALVGMASNQLGKKSGHDSFGGVDQLQTVSEASHLPKPNRGDEDDDLPSVYSSSSNLSSPQYTGKPLQNFELSEETFDLEDGFERTPSRPRRRGWFWEYMTVRARRKYEPVDQELTGSGVLSNMNIPQGWNSRANRGWFNYCIFGGISGCTVL